MLERIIEDRLDPRLAWAALGGAMLVSLAVCLYATRGTTFSGDEMTWVAFSPDTNLRVALEPHSGHLVLVSHLLYKLILETIGGNYLTFRVLTLLMVFASVSLFFAWSARRIGHWLALAPCLVLLFFGTDAGHLLQGNGFTIMLAVACGMGALVALDRDSRAGDIVCCLALCLGTITYTVALPFIVGVAVIVLARSDRWKRAWIFLLPVLIYAAWRIWVLAADIDFTRGGLHAEYILLLPAWIFQSLSGILSALSGLNYNFNGAGWLPPTAFAGPALAVAFLLLLAWRISRGSNGVIFWGLVAIALTMFTSQVLSWIPDVREPGTSRYLYPGAFVVLIVAVEAARRYPVSKNAFFAVWLITLSGFATNLKIIGDSGNSLRERAPQVEMEVTAARLINSMGFFFPGPNAKPLTDFVEDPPVAIVGGAARKYGGLGVPPDDIESQSPQFRQQLDSILIQVIDPTPTPYKPKGPLTGCEPATKFGPVYVTELRDGGATLVSRGNGTVSIGKFSDPVTTLEPALKSGQPTALGMPVDESPVPWKLVARMPFKTCDMPKL